MNKRTSQIQDQTQLQAYPLTASLILQRKCACGNHTVAGGGCIECNKKNHSLQPDSINRGESGINTSFSRTPAMQRRLTIGASDDALEQEADRIADQVLAASPGSIIGGVLPRIQRFTAQPAGQTGTAPASVDRVLASSGSLLEPTLKADMEQRFGHDFSHVRVHSGAAAEQSAREVNASAYTVGHNIVFGAKQYSPRTGAGQQLIAHELTHVLQQRTVAGLYRRAAPYIKKVSVHLKPPQSADLEWEGTPPSDAAGSDHFTVSTGKGYGDPGDPPGTCTRDCCSDAMTQCAPPWNRPGKVGACCTFFGNGFWTGTPEVEHNGWKWWTPIQPHYSSRGIALHEHTEVTGEPIGHGCVRMEEPNAKRIYDYSNRRRTEVAIDGRAAPVAFDSTRQCPGAGTSTPAEQRGQLEETEETTRFAAAPQQQAIPGLEGVMT